MEQKEMKEPVKWVHTLVQTALFVLALLGMFYNFSTSQQKTRDNIIMLEKRIDVIEQDRKEDAIRQRLDMTEIKESQKELRDKLTEILVELQNKKDRSK